MIKEYKNKFPDWCNDIFFVDYEMVLTDDLDSLLSCCLLEKEFGYKINYFYDFDNVYRSENTGNKNVIAVDADFVSGKVWGNHVTLLNPNDSYNKMAANLNVINKISRDNYHDKYCGSTLLQIWSYYGLPLPKTEEGKMILLAIDSSHKGHYDWRFKDTHTKWLEVLEFDELIDVLKKYTAQDFYNIISRYGLNQKININTDGYLETKLNLAELQGFFNFKIELPDIKFNLFRSYQSKQANLYGIKNASKYGYGDDLISLALVYKNKIKFTVKGSDNLRAS